MSSTITAAHAVTQLTDKKEAYACAGAAGKAPFDACRESRDMLAHVDGND